MRTGQWGLVAIAGLVACLACARRVRAQEVSARDLGAEQAFSDVEVGALAQAQAALVEARAMSAQLDERGALQRLLSAERTLSEILHVPSVHVWLAEVWLQMGMIAAQRGDLALARSVLARALSLDVARKVGAAEAAPKTLAMIEELARERDAAPRSRFRVQAKPENARIWLDGRERGRGSIEVDVSPGPHLLRIAAPDHTPYATLLDTWAGPRAPILVALSGTKASARLAEGPLRLESPLPKPVQEAPGEKARAPENPRERPRWWRRWPAWTAAAVIVVASTAALTVAAQNNETVAERKLHVDPGSTTP